MKISELVSTHGNLIRIRRPDWFDLEDFVDVMPADNGAGYKCLSIIGKEVLLDEDSDTWVLHEFQPNDTASNNVYPIGNWVKN